MMRTIVAAALLVATQPAFAQTGHARLSCTECHLRTNAGEQSAADLRVRNDLEFCLRCHDGRTTVSDVMHDAIQLRAAGSLDPAVGRAAGALNFIGDRDRDGYAEWDGHTIGSLAAPPGYLGEWPKGTPLTCRSCHSVHPNGRYRQLGADPYLRDADYAALARSLFPPEGSGSMALERADRFPFGLEIDAAVNSVCLACHGAMHEVTGASTRRWSDRTTTYRKHPASGVALGPETKARFETLAQPLRAIWRDPETPQVGCVTCHRAHGTRNPFGLVYWDPASTANGEDGAGRSFAGLCLSCHAVGE
jgi:hypothetical protein